MKDAKKKLKNKYDIRTERLAVSHVATHDKIVQRVDKDTDNCMYTHRYIYICTVMSIYI